MPLRKVVFWLHLIVAVPTAVVILMMSATGVVLTYEKQMIEWADREFRGSPAQPGVTATPSALIAATREWDAEATASSIVFSADPEAPAAVAVARGRTLYLDPSTAEPRGENKTGMRAFMSSVRGWHRWFNVTGDGRGLARAVTGWCNIAFLFLVLSGLYLWFPRRWTLKHFRPVTLLNTSARGKARDFNWHHVFGFWLSIPLAVVVASAAVISFPWARDLVYRLVDDPSVTAPAAPVAAAVAATASAVSTSAQIENETDPPPPEAPFDATRLDPLLAPALAQVDDWRTISVSVPEFEGEPVAFRIATGLGGQPQLRGTLTLDSETGAQLSWATFSDLAPGPRARSFLRFAHTGEFWGILGQTLAGVASLAGVILVWTGLALGWRRMVRAIRRRRTRKAMVAAPLRGRQLGTPEPWADPTPTPRPVGHPAESRRDARTPVGSAAD